MWIGTYVSWGCLNLLLTSRLRAGAGSWEKDTEIGVLLRTGRINLPESSTNAGEEGRRGVRTVYRKDVGPYYGKPVPLLVAVVLPRKNHPDVPYKSPPHLVLSGSSKSSKKRPTIGKNGRSRSLDRPCTSKFYETVLGSKSNSNMIYVKLTELPSTSDPSWPRSTSSSWR